MSFIIPRSPRVPAGVDPDEIPSEIVYDPRTGRWIDRDAEEDRRR